MVGRRTEDDAFDTRSAVLWLCLLLRQQPFYLARIRWLLEPIRGMVGRVAPVTSTRQPTGWGNVTPPFNGTSNLIYGSVNPMNFGPTDRYGSSVASITFNSSASAYILASQNGVSMNIGSGGITDAATTTQTITEPLLLTASQTWSSVGILNVTGGVNLGGNTLTDTGAGSTSLTRRYRGRAH